MLLALYETKDDLRRSIGQPLHFQETQVLSDEHHATGLVMLAVQGATADPDGHRWVAEVTLIDGRIVRVE